MKLITFASAFLFLFSYSSPIQAKEGGARVSSYECRYVFGQYQVWAVGVTAANSEEHFLFPVTGKMSSKEQCQRMARNTPVPGKGRK